MSDSLIMSDLVGGDRKDVATTTLNKFEKKAEDIWKKIFATAGTPVAFQAFVLELCKKYGIVDNATGTLAQAKERIETLWETKQIFEKAVGAYDNVDAGDLKGQLADEIEIAIDRLKQGFATAGQSAIGSGNRQYAQKAHATFRLLMKDFGDGDDTTALLKSYNQSTQEIARLLSSLATNSTAAHPSHRSVNRLRI